MITMKEQNGTAQSDPELRGGTGHVDGGDRETSWKTSSVGLARWNGGRGKAFWEKQQHRQRYGSVRWEWRGLWLGWGRSTGGTRLKW